MRPGFGTPPAQRCTNAASPCWRASSICCCALRQECCYRLSARVPALCLSASQREKVLGHNYPTLSPRH